jgi:hypothetical protein
MSSVRMCDRCGRVFSEKEDGWETGQVNKRVTDPKTGESRVMSVAIDSCGDCGTMQVPAAMDPVSPEVRAEIRKAIQAEKTSGKHERA